MEARRDHASGRDSSSLFLPDWAQVAGCYSRFTRDRTRAQSILLAAAFLAALYPSRQPVDQGVLGEPCRPDERTVPTPAPLKPQFSDSLDPRRPSLEWPLSARPISHLFSVG